MVSQHTLGHVNCPACEEAKKIAMYTGQFETYLFPHAAGLWLASRNRISPNTRGIYEHYIQALSTFFGELRVADIHIGNVVAYQRWRQEEIRRSKQHAAAKRSGDADPSDGASLINHEINCVLRQVLKHAGRWDEVGKYYEPLPLPRESIGMALTDEEEDHLFRTARSNPRWLVAYCCDLISRNTTAGPGEIRHLRIRNVDLDNHVIKVEEGVKNEFRVRPLPLNQDSETAVSWLLDRYRAMCSQFGIHADPDHYLLYHRAQNRGAAPDPSRPMGSWKKAHYAMRKKAAEKFPRLARLRRYDFRHTACTDMLENPAISFATIEHMMGHRLSSNTKRRYDHLRNSALRAAAEALDHRHTRPHLEVAPPPVLDPVRPREPGRVIALPAYSRLNGR